MNRDTQLIAFCQELIRIPSPSGQEQGVAEFIQGKMNALGFDEVTVRQSGRVIHLAAKYGMVAFTGAERLT